MIDDAASDDVTIVDVITNYDDAAQTWRSNVFVLDSPQMKRYHDIGFRQLHTVTNLLLAGTLESGFCVRQER